MDLHRAIIGFFKKRTSYPRFKKKGAYDSFRLTGCIHVYERLVKLPMLGKIRLKHDTDNFHGRVLSATISRTADRWFISINVEQQVQEPAPIQGPVVGIDLGLHTYAVMSDGTGVEMPVLPDGTLLKRRHRQLSRKQRGSNNRKKAQLRLSRLYMRIRNKRQDFLHKLTTPLAKTKSEIVVEDLAVQDMQQSQMAAGISNAAWSEFRRQLEYKCKWYGSTLTVAPRYYPSTKRCSSCATLKDIPLSERTYRCKECGLEIDRDLNAALNLEQLSRSGSGRSNALGDEAIASSLNGEAGCVLHVSPVSERS
jgi:putative transposase